MNAAHALPDGIRKLLSELMLVKIPSDQRGFNSGHKQRTRPPIANWHCFYHVLVMVYDLDSLCFDGKELLVKTPFSLGKFQSIQRRSRLATISYREEASVSTSINLQA